MTEAKLDAESICRICLCEHSELFLIYDETPIEQGMNIVQILNECTHYTVERYDKMPHQMCASCIKEARAAYRFKRTADAAYRTLVEQLGHMPRKNKGNYIDSSTQTEQSSLYPCEVCDEKLFSSSELRHHRQAEHQNELKCKICGKAYEQLRFLQLHLQQTHQQRLQPSFSSSNQQCRQCQRSFTRRDHLLRHMRNVHREPDDAALDKEWQSKNEQAEGNLILAKSSQVQSLLEEPEMIVMAASGDACLDPYWINQQHEAEQISECDLTNPISSDDELKPATEIAQNLWFDMEPDINMAKADESNEIATDCEGQMQFLPYRKKRYCSICDTKFQSYEELHQHVAKEHRHHALLAKHQCRICLRNFRRENHLQRHMQTVHIKSQNYEVPSVDGSDLKKGKRCADELTMLVEDDEQRENSHIVERGSNEATDDEDLVRKSATEDESASAAVQIKLEPMLSENNMATVATSMTDLSSVALKCERIEDEMEAKETREQITSAINTDGKAIGDGKAEMSLKRDRPKVEIVREYLQKKRLSRRQNTRGENPENRCDQCQRTFSRHCHLLRHKLSHLEQKPHSCPHCSKGFARSDHLKAHVQSLHGSKEHKCRLCGAAFVRPEALERHMLSKHDGAGIEVGGASSTESKLHSCDYCEKKFTSRSYLRKHTLMHTDMLYACKNCDKTFKERAFLREHEKTHQAERNYLCCICGDSFARNDYLRVHMRRHNGEKPYKCKYCGKGFPRATDVKVHERYHTGTKPNLCTLCGKGFHRAYNLTIHMRTHTGERPYKCDQCTKSFTQSNDLKAHIRRHTGERYKCNECDACFLQLYAMRHHALSAHGTHIKSKTGRLQRTGLYDDAQLQPLITTVLVTPTQSCEEHDMVQPSLLLRPLPHTDQSQGACSFPTTPVETFTYSHLHPPTTTTAASTTIVKVAGHEYLSTYVDLPN